MSVRPAREEDAEAVDAVFVAAAREAWGAFVDDEAVKPDLAGWRRRIADRDFLVAERDGRVVGFASVAGEELATLYTHPDVWGSGLGRELMDAALGLMREAGVQEAWLWTEERNERPRRFYEALGWRLDGAVQQRVWEGVPLRELRYRLPLGVQVRPVDRSVAEALTLYGAHGAGAIALGSGDGAWHVHVVHVEAGGAIGAHEAGYDQLWIVVTGEGWVSGPDHHRIAVRAGQAAFFPKGRVHAKGSETGIMAVMVQGDRLRPPG